MTERADLVVLGGGLAGLSLALRLAQTGYRGRVQIIEPREAYVDDRSWGFWTPSGGPWAAMATCTWAQWRFSARGRPGVLSQAEGWRYAYLRSSAFYDYALRAIAKCERISLALGTRAGEITGRGDGVDVATSAGTVSARHVVDTRPPSRERLDASLMFQSFVGREVALDAPGLDHRQVELMTDMRSDARGFVFSYVLPLSARRALVEATRFSTRPVGTDVLAADLDALLASRGWAQARVLRSEQAVLPMGLPETADAASMPGIVRAGTTGGALRAASGYGFLRIQAWADRCADSLTQGGPPVGHPPEPRLRRWMDRVFLRALAAHPGRAPEFFLSLARSVPGPAFVRFMSDEANGTDLVRIIAALPPWPFLQALGPKLARTRQRA